METKGHFCYNCNQYFHDSDINVAVDGHKDCISKSNLGICVDRREFGEFYIGNLREKSVDELIEIIQKLVKDEQVPKPMRFRCNRCGRDKFTQKTPHICGTQFRKRGLTWTPIYSKGA